MPARNFTDNEELQIAHIYCAGFSARAIAKAYGLSHHISIVSALRRQGVKQRSPAARNRLYSLNPHVFDSIDNELAAYWWGFLYADGHVVKRTLAVALKRTDKSHLERLRSFLESESPIKTEKRNGKYFDCKIEFTDRHLARRLRQLGIIVRRTAPQLVIDHLPEPLTHHWIRGYFDGDGSARKSPSLAFCGSRKLLMWIRAIMAEAADTNPDLSVHKHNVSDIHYLDFAGRRVALRVADYLYHDATIWMPRKRNVIESWPAPQKRERDEKGRYT